MEALKLVCNQRDDLKRVLLLPGWQLQGTAKPGDGVYIKAYRRVKVTQGSIQ
jgi:hypothetical protein